MLSRLDASIARRLKVFDANLDRALELSRFSESPGVEFSRTALIRDVRLSAIVFAVGSVDELCKGLFYECLWGYLCGDVEPIGRMGASIPLTAARCFSESKHMEPMPAAQFEALAVRELQRYIERDNFQSYEQIAKRFSECGLGKLKCILPPAERSEFASSLDALAAARHTVVHRVGLADFGGIILEDETTGSVLAGFEHHVDNLRNGGHAIAKALLICVK